MGKPASLRPLKPGNPSSSAFVAGLIEALHGDRSPTVKTLLVTLQAMSAYIQKVRRDIAASGPAELKELHLPAAADELEAVVQATAQATHRIMDAAEAVQTIALGIDEQPQQALIAETTRIFEACTFQDITGQRVTKVVQALNLIDQKLDTLIACLGDALDKEEAVIAARPAPPPPVSDADLLNGPQLPAVAKSQAEIDALFDSL